MTWCSVIGCSNVGGHYFPRDKEMKSKWKVALRQQNQQVKGRMWSPSKRAVVCKKHFAESCYKTTNNRNFGQNYLCRKLKADAVPTLNLGVESKSQTPAQKRRAERMRTARSPEPCNMEIDAYEETVATETSFSILDSPKMVDASCQSPNIDELFDKWTAERKTRNQLQPLLSVQTMSNELFHFYTGLKCKDKFNLVLNTLGPAAYELNYHAGIIPKIDVPNQFLITLIKLRRHMTNYELSLHFNIPVRQISNIFITWINFMYKQWMEICWWPSREMVNFFMPEDFRKKFPKTRVILDGTEFPIKKPFKDPINQQQTFSTYKNKNTCKVVVGVSPGGLLTYVSPAYGGSTSDRQIVERSTLPELCDPLDEVMADKGFNVEDLFLLNRVSLNLPKFFRKKNRLSTQQVLEDRKVASKRVHVERIIGLAKTFRILVDPMNNVESSLATEISFVVFTLCNFRKNIVGKNA